eukprot:10789883-Karenia_brevis.AAC.1
MSNPTSMAVSGVSAFEDLKALSKAPLVANHKTADLALKMAECSKALLYGKVRHMVAEAAGLPMLMSFTADGTPIRYHQRKK